MRYYQLFEYNSSQTLNNYREPLESRLQTDSRAEAVLGTEPTPEAILRHLEAIDPTNKKAFMLNLIKWYIDGSMRFIEDAYKTKDVFPLYMKFKNRDDVPHISKLSFNEFLELGDRLGDTKSGAELNKEEELAFYKSGQAELFKDTDEVKIVIPKTKRSAIYFGRNTKWCTSAVNDNMFDRYEGPLYIFLFKKENKRWQFEFDSEQFMDERDDELELEDIHKGFKLLDISEKEMVKHCNEIIRILKNPSEELQRLAVQQNGLNIRYIDYPSKELQRLAIVNRADSLKHINNPSEALKKLAIEKNGLNMKFIENPSEELQILAVQQDGYSIQYIKNPSEEVKTLAVQQNGMAIQFIENPSENIQRLAVQKNGYAIRHIDDPSEEVKRIAVDKSGYAIQFIDEPSEYLQLMAVSKNGDYISYIDDPTEKVQKVAVIQDGNLLRFITSPSEEVEKLAVQQNGNAIMFIDNPSEDVQKLAVSKNDWAINYINNPSEEVKRMAANKPR